MSATNLTKSNITNKDEEIDLAAIFSLFWRGKWIVIASTACFAAFSVWYALSLADTYESQVLLAPATEQKNVVPSQLGGLAALAGVNLGGGAAVDKTTLSIEVLKSRDFIMRFIDQHKLLVPLMAAERYVLDTEKLIINSDIYNEVEECWVRSVRPPKQVKPSLQEAHEFFINNVLSVEQDKMSGIVRISITSVSPLLAQQWLEWLIRDLNQEMRQLDIIQSELSIEYLQQQLDIVKLASLQESLFVLMEEQLGKLMLANVQKDYAFRIIDQPLVPEVKAGPKRALICIVITLLGGLFGLFLVIIFSLIKTARQKKSTVAENS